MTMTVVQPQQHRSAATMKPATVVARVFPRLVCRCAQVSYFLRGMTELMRWTHTQGFLEEEISLSTYHIIDRGEPEGRILRVIYGEGRAPLLLDGHQHRGNCVACAAGLERQQDADAHALQGHWDNLIGHGAARGDPS